MLQTIGKMAGDDVIEQLAKRVVLAGVIEEFEMTEAHVAGRQAQQHGASFLAFAIHRRLRAGHAERARGGNAERVQVFAGEEFANRRT